MCILRIIMANCYSCYRDSSLALVYRVSVLGYEWITRVWWSSLKGWRDVIGLKVSKVVSVCLFKRQYTPGAECSLCPCRLSRLTCTVMEHWHSSFQNTHTHTFGPSHRPFTIFPVLSKDSQSPLKIWSPLDELCSIRRTVAQGRWPNLTSWPF